MVQVVLDLIRPDKRDIQGSITDCHGRGKVPGVSRVLSFLVSHVKFFLFYLVFSTVTRSRIVNYAVGRSL